MLTQWRGELIERLDEIIEGGGLHLLAEVHTAIVAVDAFEQLSAVTNGAAGEGLVFVSDDGDRLKLTLRRSKGLQATVELTVSQAACLAPSLSAAVARRV